MRIRNDRSARLSRVWPGSNRRFANPVVCQVAGRLIIRPRGRRTGRAFATPVLTFTTRDIERGALAALELFADARPVRLVGVRAEFSR